MGEDSYFKALLLYWLARYAIALVVFARLAMHADKWWIILFSVFFAFTSPPKQNNTREENHDEDF